MAASACRMDCISSSKRSGLRIIQALVRQINGRLQLGRGPGNEGACFKVFFPATAAV
jgi:two-component sensor histidine kinase